MTDALWMLLMTALLTLAAIVSAVMAVDARRHARTSAGAAQDAVAEARRANDRNEALDLAAVNAQAQRALTIDEYAGHQFQLRNRGETALRDVEFVDPPAGVFESLPQHFNLQQKVGESEFFTFIGGGKERPKFLSVRWEGLAEPVLIEFPYDVMNSIG